MCVQDAQKKNTFFCFLFTDVFFMMLIQNSEINALLIDIWFQLVMLS